MIGSTDAKDHLQRAVRGEADWSQVRLIGRYTLQVARPPHVLVQLYPPFLSLESSSSSSWSSMCAGLDIARRAKLEHGWQAAGMCPFAADVLHGCRRISHGHCCCARAA